MAKLFRSAADIMAHGGTIEECIRNGPLELSGWRPILDTLNRF